MKKIIIAFFAGIAFITPSILAASISFPDVKSTDWFYDDVANMVEWNVIKGNDDGTFKPGSNVNRAELSAMWNRYNDYLDGRFALIGSTSGSTSSSTAYVPNKYDWLKVILLTNLSQEFALQKKNPIIRVTINSSKKDIQVLLVSYDYTYQEGTSGRVSEDLNLNSILINTVKDTLADIDWATNYSFKINIL